MKFSKAFIIDDDQIFHFIIKKLLQKHKLELELQFFENGLDAMAELRKVNAGGIAGPDLIFLDINMPVLDGWQFLDEYKALKDQLIRTPVIFLISSSDNCDDRAKAKVYCEEIRDYYIKPVGQRELDQIFL